MFLSLVHFESYFEMKCRKDWKVVDQKEFHIWSCPPAGATHTISRCRDLQKILFRFLSSSILIFVWKCFLFSFSVSPDTSCVVQGFNSNRWAAGYGSRPVVDSPHTHTHIFFWKKKKKKTEKNRRPKGGWERRKCYCTTFPPSSSPSPADTSAIIKMEDERIKKEGVYFIFLLLLLLPLLSVTANRFYFLFSRKIHMI